MMKSYCFPSTYEFTNQELSNVANNLLDGIKIKINENDYIVGNLALREGYSPHKNINSAPTEEEYQLLLKAGLLLAASQGDFAMNLTVCFPFSTYMLYRDEVRKIIGTEQTITFDGGTFGQAGLETKKINIAEVDVIPEIVGCITAVREGSIRAQGNFFMISLGFGTCEAVVSTPSGIVNRSAVSMNWVRYAVQLFEHELSKKFYLDLKTEHQLDVLFQEGRVTINRVRHDVADLRKKVLRMYYNDVISPRLKKAFTDDDFSKCNQMFVAGGGAYYQDLIDCIKEEFGNFLSISVYPEPEKCASHGCCLHSKSKLGNASLANLESLDPDAFLKSSAAQLAVGLDVGNASTCVTFVECND